MNVAVLGASRKPDRYSYKAVKLLAEKGHTPFPVHPSLQEVDGIPVCPSLREIGEPIDTITVYLSAANSDKVADDILASGAKRVIFNPGAENPVLASQLAARGIEVVQACTLVMLKTNQF
ncbi:MAG: CoA-binding protein [Kiritimatiellae bacterium]|nr:CoA-binding protein [Kiritimatiellia bacterium]